MTEEAWGLIREEAELGHATPREFKSPRRGATITYRYSSRLAACILCIILLGENILCACRTGALCVICTRGPI